MSNLKSKFLLGVMIVAVMFVGVVALNATKASAASCSITTTLRAGSKGTQVKCLQTALGLTADGSFGAKTKAAVVAWQKSQGLVADGVFGAKSRAAFSGSASGYPAGCTSNTGFSATTGLSCATGGSSLPAGCTSTAGFSSTTGASCSTGVVNNSGPLSVSLASDNPAAGNLIQGQATADLAHFMFTGTGTLSNVTLQRSGISDNSVFPNVYLYNGTTRLTDAASINSMGQIVFNGLNIAVNGSLNLSVRADITSSVSTSQSTVMVTLTSYTVSGGTATTVSVAGNSFYINSGTGILSTVNVGVNTAAGGPGATSTSVAAGTTGLAIWSAPVTVSLHSVHLKSAAFDVIGSAPANALANVGLFANGVKVASSTGIGSNGYLTFDLSAAPFTMITGATTLEVRADIVNGSARDFTVSLQHASDLMVTDSQVGVNVGITYNSGTFAIASAGKISVQQGTLVAQSDPTFNSQTNITGGSANAAIASYKLTSYGEDVKVNQVTVTPVLTAGPGGIACGSVVAGSALANVTLYWNGAPVGSSQNAVFPAGGSCTVSALTFTPGSNLTISGGTTGVFQVHADLVTTGGTNYTSGTVGATVVLNQYQGISSGQTGTISPSGSNTMNIQMGSLTIAKNASFLTQTVNPNSSQTEIASFVLQNQSTSEAVQVNSLNIGFYTNAAMGTQLTTSSTPATTNFSTLTVGGITGNSPTPIGQPTGMNTFSTNFSIPAGGSQTVNVYANLGAAVSTSFVVSLQPVAVGATSRVSISSSATAGQVINLGVGTLSAPTLVSSASTNAQYISSSGTGAVNAAQETYNFVASSGTATVVGLKFAALSGVSTTPTSTAVAQFATAGDTGSILVGDSSSFTVGDNVLVTTTGVFGGTHAVGVVKSKADGTHMLITISVPMVAGCTTATTCSDGVAGTIYKLAVSGATGVALNSPGVATGSATFNGGVAYLSAITGASGNGIAVPNNPSGVTVPAFLSFGPVNTSGGVNSGTTAQALLEYVQYQTGSTTSYLAPSAAGTTLTLVGSKPTITLNSSSQALTNGTSVLLGTVTVAADNGGDIALSEIPLTVSLNAGTSGTPVIVVNGIKLTDNNGVTLSNLTSTNLVGTTSSSSTQVFGSGTANHYRISAGQSKTFEIRADFTGSTFGTSATASVSLGANTSFVWDDINGGSTSNVATNGTITSGLLGSGLYSYPSGSVSIHN